MSEDVVEGVGDDSSFLRVLADAYSLKNCVLVLHSLKNCYVCDSRTTMCVYTLIDMYTGYQIDSCHIKAVFLTSSGSPSIV